MTPVLLTYHIAPAKLAKIQVLCLRLGIRVCPVPPEDYGQPLAALVGLAKKDASPVQTPAADFADEMLVMAHFRPGMMDTFLNGFRQARIPPVPLKAMLTETNAQWNSLELHRAIAEEHEAMRRGAPVHR